MGGRINLLAAILCDAESGLSSQFCGRCRPLTAVRFAFCPAAVFDCRVTLKPVGPFLHHSTQKRGFSQVRPGSGPDLDDGYIGLHGTHGPQTVLSSATHFSPDI